MNVGSLNQISFNTPSVLGHSTDTLISRVVVLKQETYSLVPRVTVVPETNAANILLNSYVTQSITLSSKSIRRD